MRFPFHFRHRLKRGAPLSLFARAMIVCAQTIIALGGLMSVSPEIHAAFCPYEHAKQHSTARHEPPPPWTHEDDCAAVHFQEGFSPEASLLASAPAAPIALPVFPAPPVAPSWPAPAALHPLACGPPVSA